MRWSTRFRWLGGGYTQRRAITRRHRDQGQRADQNLRWISAGSQSVVEFLRASEAVAGTEQK